MSEAETQIDIEGIERGVVECPRCHGVVVWVKVYSWWRCFGCARRWRIW